MFINVQMKEMKENLDLQSSTHIPISQPALFAWLSGAMAHTGGLPPGPTGCVCARTAA